MQIAKMLMMNPGVSGVERSWGGSVIDPGKGLSDFAAALAERQRTESLSNLLDAGEALIGQATGPRPGMMDVETLAPVDVSRDSARELRERVVIESSPNDTGDDESENLVSDPARDVMASTQVSSGQMRGDTQTVSSERDDDQTTNVTQTKGDRDLGERQANAKAASASTVSTDTDVSEDTTVPTDAGVSTGPASKSAPVSALGSQGAQSTASQKPGDALSQTSATVQSAAATLPADTVTSTEGKSPTTPDAATKAQAAGTRPTESAATLVESLKALANAAKASPSTSPQVTQLSQTVQLAAAVAMSANAAEIAAGEVSAETPKAVGGRVAGNVPLSTGADLLLKTSSESTSGVNRSAESSAAVRTTLSALPDQVIKAVRLITTNGEKTLTIRLIPESLGELHLEVRSTPENMHVKLVSSHPAVREILGSQLQSLRDSLRQEGLDVTGIVVTGEASAGFLASQQSWSHGAASNTSTSIPSVPSARTAPAESASDGRQAIYHGSEHDGALNLFV